MTTPTLGGPDMSTRQSLCLLLIVAAAVVVGGFAMAAAPPVDLIDVPSASTEIRPADGVTSVGLTAYLGTFAVAVSSIIALTQAVKHYFKISGIATLGVLAVVSIAVVAAASWMRMGWAQANDAQAWVELFVSAFLAAATGSGVWSWAKATIGPELADHAAVPPTHRGGFVSLPSLLLTALLMLAALAVLPGCVADRPYAALVSETLDQRERLELPYLLTDMRIGESHRDFILSQHRALRDATDAVLALPPREPFELRDAPPTRGLPGNEAFPVPKPTPSPQAAPASRPWRPQMAAN